MYDEPFFKNTNFFLRNTLGNWEIAPIYTYQSGQWVTSQSAIDSNLNGDYAGDRTIFNASGVPGTGSGVIPLCNSSRVTCPGALPDAHARIPQASCWIPGDQPANAQYIQARLWRSANVGRNTLQLDPTTTLT